MLYIEIFLFTQSNFILCMPICWYNMQERAVFQLFVYISCHYKKSIYGELVPDFTYAGIQVKRMAPWQKRISLACDYCLCQCLMIHLSIPFVWNHNVSQHDSRHLRPTLNLAYMSVADLCQGWSILS